MQNSSGMATVEITTDNFTSIIERPGIVLLDLWAAWCGPCRMFAPIFEAASGRHPDVTFGKVDTDAEPAIASALGVKGIPTIAVFRDGILVFSQAGMLPAGALDQLIEKIAELDMEVVRKHTHEQSSAQSG